MNILAFNNKAKYLEDGAMNYIGKKHMQNIYLLNAHMTPIGVIGTYAGVPLMTPLSFSISFFTKRFVVTNTLWDI